MSKSKINAAQVLLEVSRGYSIIDVNGEVFYFKHPNNMESLQSEEQYEIIYNRAIKRGISSEEKLLNNYIKRGKWSLEKEEKIKSLKWMIDKSTTASLKITDDHQRNVFSSGIKKQEEELSELQDKRHALIGQSAESWASQQRMFKMVEDHVFSDAKFKKNITIGEDVSFVVNIQKKILELSEKRSLLAAVFQSEFFDVYSIQYRNPMTIFGVDFFNITIFQRYLFSYASVLLNKLKNVEMPDEIRNDPVKIFDYNPDNKNKETKTSHGIDDIKQTLKNKGKLTAEDLIN
jgi:hypothetical protein